LAFEQELETLEPLLFVLNRLLEALLRRMKCSSRLTSGLQLELALENRSFYRRTFVVPAPTLEANVLLRILETHLEQLHLENRPVGVRLRLEATAEKTCALDLFEPVLRDPNRFGETLARLYALLGEDRVGIPLPPTCHFPDPVRMGAASALYQEHPRLVIVHPTPLRGLPLHRLRPAPPARVDFIHSQPIHIASETVSGKIMASRGPYRLSGHWWDAESRCMEEWDICVRLQKGNRRSASLVRIGTPAAPALGADSNASEWRLEGFYNT
jgi:protein ImuB